MLPHGCEDSGKLALITSDLIALPAVGAATGFVGNKEETTNRELNL